MLVRGNGRGRMSKKEQIKHSPECGWILQVMDTLKKLFKNTKRVLRYVIILKKCPSLQEIKYLL